MWGIHISGTVEWLYSIQSSMELSRPAVGQHRCPLAPYGLAHGQKSAQTSTTRGIDFAEHMSLKQLDGFIPLEIL